MLDGMYAQLLPCNFLPDRCAGLERLVADRMMPALRRVPGFAGALNLVDRTTGSLLLIVLWESAEQAGRPLSAHGGDVAVALASVAALSDCVQRPASAWEVSARI
jgi:hypothetical protein